MTGPVVEVAVYRVHENGVEDFLRRQSAAHEILKRLRGFRSIRTVKAIGQSNMFLDYCEWDSHEYARAANIQADSLPEFQVYFDMGEGVVSFDAYEKVEAEM